MCSLLSMINYGEMYLIVLKPTAGPTCSKSLDMAIHINHYGMERVVCFFNTSNSKLSWPGCSKAS